MAIELEEFCHTIQQDLDDLATSNYPAFKRRPTGMLSAVRSEANRSGYNTEYLTDGGDGKQKQVLETWIKPVPVTNTFTSKQDVCTGGVERGVEMEIRTLTGFASSEVMLYTDAEMRKRCNAPSEVRAQRVASTMSSLFERINRILIAKYAAGVGGFINGVAAGRELELLHYDGITEAAKPDGQIKMSEDMADLGVSGTPIVVGAGAISRYARLAALGCCNDYGQNINALNNGVMNFYRDQDVDIIMAGDENIIAFAPGAVQMATYNEYRGEFRRVHEHFAMQTIEDPITGLTVDQKWVFNECDELWREAYFLHFDLFQMRDLFMDDDNREDVNYSFLYKGVRTEAAS